MDANLGRWLGPYRLEERIGGGAFATVYRGRRAGEGPVRAVKVMRDSIARDPEFRARFHREAELAARLRHPGIVRVFEHDAGGAVPFIAMELVEGESLGRIVAAGTQLLRPLGGWVAQVAEALDHAHRQGLVHRDVKPANVLVSEVDGRALLADFGMARALDLPGLTRTGMALGSAAYMSPEQCRGAGRELDGRSDVYGLAVTLFEVVTGAVPFGRDLRAVVGHLRRQPPSARAFNPLLPPEMDAVLQRGLAKEPEARYRTARELTAAFLPLLAATPRVALAAG